MDVTALEALQMDQFNEMLGDLRPLFARYTRLAQAELDIVLHIQPGEQRRLLEEQHAVGAGATSHYLVRVNAAAAGWL